MRIESNQPTSYFSYNNLQSRPENNTRFATEDELSISFEAQQFASTNFLEPVDQGTNPNPNPGGSGGGGGG